MSESYELVMEVTASMLPAERSRASFDVELMTNILDNGKDQTKRKRFILSTQAMTCQCPPGQAVLLTLTSQEPYTYGDEKYNWERGDYLREHVKSFIEIHEDFVGKWKPTRDELVSTLFGSALLVVDPHCVVPVRYG